MPIPSTHISSLNENSQNLNPKCRQYLLLFVWLKKKKLKETQMWNPTKLGKKHWAHITQREITFASFKLN